MASSGGELCLAYGSEEILKEVRNFVKGSTYESKVSSEELVKSGLFLLKNLPSSRQAVLEHLCNVFDETVNTHILKIELGNKITDAVGPELDAVIEDVEQVLMSFVKSNPDAWAPIISAWAIELLGQISSKYSDRRGVPPSSCLNELLQLWMTCKPTKILIEIASECFASMIGGAPDVCVDALLEASVKHSPHFDWVVAHIGSCFPNTIITRVLMCGLKDFHLHGSSQSEVSTSSEEKIPKMASVVGILGHLASQHGQDIRNALLTLFEGSLQEQGESMQSDAVPFLLHQASMSPLLLQIISTDFVHTVTPSVLNKLSVLFKKKRSPAFQDPKSLINLVVHLLTKTDTGAYGVILFLLDIAAPPDQTGSEPMDTGEAVLPVVQSACSTILDQLLSELQKVVQCKRQGVELPLLQALQHHTNALCKQMSNGNQKRWQWVCGLLSCVAAYSGENCAAEILENVLFTACNPQQLCAFIEILQEVQVGLSDVLNQAITQVMESLEPPAQVEAQSTVLNGLLRLAHWQTSTKLGNSIRVRESLRDHLKSLTTQLYSKDIVVSSVAMEIIDLIGLPATLDISSITRLCCAVVTFFFQSLSLKDLSMKCKNSRACKHYLGELSGLSAAQRMVLRFLLEGSLSKEYGLAFGSKKYGPDADVTTVEKPKPGLLQENKRDSISMTLPQSHCAVFYAGVIGRGLKPLPKPSSFSKEEERNNRQILMDVLWTCTHCVEKDDQPDSMDTNQTAQPKYTQHIPPQVGRFIADLLLELASPDVMYNGIIWPDEEFMRVTVERDLLIKKKFDDNPVLWDVIDLITSAPGAVCHCSALLRGVTATLITHWESCREKVVRNSPQALDTALKLAHCLRKGDMLPEPLCYVGELFSYLEPFEVYLLLLNTWRYLKENPPPHRPPGCDPRYLEVIKCILHKNISELGHLYARFTVVGPGR